MSSGIPSGIYPAPYDFGQLGALDRICNYPDQEQAKREARSELSSMPAYLRNAIYKHARIRAKCKDDGDRRFGEHHALDNLKRLAAAVRKYAIKVSGSPTKDATQVLLSRLSAVSPNEEFGYILGEASEHNIIDYLDAKDCGHLAGVCKTFRDAISMNQELWALFHEQKGIPQVQGFPGELRNYRRDYFTLLPITYGRKIIEKTLLLKMVGSIPKIRREVFARLYDQDPFNEKVSIGKNYVFVVVPGLVRGEKGQVKQFALEQLRGLRNVPEEDRFIFSQNSSKAVFKQCGRRSKKTRVILMRKQVVDKSRNKTFEDQERLIGQHQMQVTDLSSRGLLDVLTIFLKKTCLDGGVPLLTYARCSDSLKSDPLKIDGQRRQPVIGGFFPTHGVDVHESNGYYGHYSIGVVPCIPADAPPVLLPE